MEFGVAYSQGGSLSTDSGIKLEFRRVGYCNSRKTMNLEKNSKSKDKNQQ